MQPASDPQRVGWCNDPLPDTNVYARFLYFVRFLAANGFYVIIDNHFNVDSLAMDQPDTWVRNIWTSCILLGPLSAPGTRSFVFSSLQCLGLLKDTHDYQCSWPEDLCVLDTAFLGTSSRETVHWRCRAGKLLYCVVAQYKLARPPFLSSLAHVLSIFAVFLFL